MLTITQEYQNMLVNLYDDQNYDMVFDLIDSFIDPREPLDHASREFLQLLLFKMATDPTYLKRIVFYLEKIYVRQTTQTPEANQFYNLFQFATPLKDSKNPTQDKIDFLNKIFASNNQDTLDLGFHILAAAFPALDNKLYNKELMKHLHTAATNDPIRTYQFVYPHLTQMMKPEQFSIELQDLILHIVTHLYDILGTDAGIEIDSDIATLAKALANITPEEHLDKVLEYCKVILVDDKDNHTFAKHFLQSTQNRSPNKIINLFSDAAELMVKANFTFFHIVNDEYEWTLIGLLAFKHYVTIKGIISPIIAQLSCLPQAAAKKLANDICNQEGFPKEASTLLQKFASIKLEHEVKPPHKPEASNQREEIIFSFDKKNSTISFVTSSSTLPQWSGEKKELPHKKEESKEKNKDDEKKHFKHN